VADEDRHRFYSVQHQVGELIRIASIMALPFMPVKANETLEIIGVDLARRNMTFAEWGKDPFYGRKGDKGLAQLFPRSLSPDEVKSETMKELMKRRRAEKLALKEELRRKVKDEGLNKDQSMSSIQ